MLNNYYIKMIIIIHNNFLSTFIYVYNCDKMVFDYKKLIDEEIDRYDCDEGIIDALGATRNDMIYDYIRSDFEDAVSDKKFYKHLFDIAKEEKDLSKARKKVDEELKKIIIDSEKGLEEDPLLWTLYGEFGSLVEK